ncbi:MAG TPA: hypothetical protein VGB85_33385, partial [Nannocystis sp.]
TARAALAAHVARHGPGSLHAGNVGLGLALILAARGDQAGALAEARRGVDLRRAHYGPHHRDTASGQLLLAGMLLDFDDTPAALAVLDEVAAVPELPADLTLELRFLRARADHDLGRTAEALAEVRRIVGDAAGPDIPPLFRDELVAWLATH